MNTFIYIYIYCVNERTQKKTLNRCVCPQENERQQKRPVTHGIRNKKKRKNKKFTTPYHQNLEQNVVPENASNLKNMNSIANCKLISKVSDHLPYVLCICHSIGSTHLWHPHRRDVGVGSSNLSHVCGFFKLFTVHFCV